MDNCHITEAASLMERMVCYRGGQFNGGRMVMLQKRSLNWRENGDTEMVPLNGHFLHVP